MIIIIIFIIFKPCFPHGAFSKSSHTSDLKSGTPVTSLAGVPAPGQITTVWMYLFTLTQTLWYLPVNTHTDSVIPTCSRSHRLSDTYLFTLTQTLWYLPVNTHTDSMIPTCSHSHWLSDTYLLTLTQTPWYLPVHAHTDWVIPTCSHSHRLSDTYLFTLTQTLWYLPVDMTTCWEVTEPVVDVADMELADDAGRAVTMVTRAAGEDPVAELLVCQHIPSQTEQINKGKILLQKQERTNKQR